MMNAMKRSAAISCRLSVHMAIASSRFSEDPPGIAVVGIVVAAPPDGVSVHSYQRDVAEVSRVSVAPR